MSRILRYCFAIFIIAGLLTGSIAAPAAGMTHDAAAMMSMADDNDMPCCPHAPAPAEARKCPCMAACVSQAASAFPPDAILTFVAPVAERLEIPTSDAARDSLGEAPPPRPPRTLVHSA